jgi:hypothetical protein
MPYFRLFLRLPALLRVISVLSLLFSVVGLGLLLGTFIIVGLAAARRVLPIELNCVSLTFACIIVVHISKVRFREVGLAS